MAIHMLEPQVSLRLLLFQYLHFKMGMGNQCVKDFVLEIVILMCFSNIIIRIVGKPKREQHFNLFGT